jgi:hypothetical protein
LLPLAGTVRVNPIRSPNATIRSATVPLFDKSQASPEVPDDLIEAINGVIDRLRANLVDQITLPDPPYGFRIPNMTRGYIQAHLRRLIMFVEGGHAEYLAGRPLMTEMASRAIYETVATLVDFSRKLKPLCVEGDYRGVEALVSKAAFVTRMPSILEEHGEGYRAPQILNQIDKMIATYPTYRSAYDSLCEIVHPNGFGALIYFAKMENGIMKFAPAGIAPERPIESLFLAALLLATVELEVAEMEKSLTVLGHIANVAKFIADNTPGDDMAE